MDMSHHAHHGQMDHMAHANHIVGHEANLSAGYSTDGDTTTTMPMMMSGMTVRNIVTLFIE